MKETTVFSSWHPQLSSIPHILDFLITWSKPLTQQKRKLRLTDASDLDRKWDRSLAFLTAT